MQMFDVLNVTTYTDKAGQEQKSFTPLWSGFPKERRQRVCVETGCSKHDRRLSAFP